MSQAVSKQDYGALMKKALVELRETKAKLQSLEMEKTEPIAIIGMSCRFPGGAENLEKFWHLLRHGKDAITEVPQDRWDIDDFYAADRDAPGKIYTRYGGFVEYLQEFDASFFGITPREARVLDPQHRLLLETTWEAIENAALNPQQLAKTQTGVFIGICSHDYSQILGKRAVTEIDSYMGTGNSHSSAAGRLSFILGLTGPSLAIDTACSSSLVTVHLACSSLRNRESDLALAGGVNRIITPELNINFSKAKMLAADGHCKTFDASADGFVRSEGCGMILLKRLSDAIADRDNILAVIKGSAVNQDGRTSGLTVPHGPSQQAVIRKALETANVAPAQVSYIEAHGTGTSLGDPIEIGALGAVFSKSHSQQNPLIIGSVKTNIGHLEGAAGIAGLIKVVLQLQHQEIAPHLNFHQPSPYINWQELPLQIPTQAIPWQTAGKSRIAGVSSFSFSGTNAHIIVEEAPDQPKNQDLPKRPVHLVALSAKTAKALENLVIRYQHHLEIYPELELADICHTANTGRAHFNHRLAIIAASRAELTDKLNQITNSQETSGVFPQLASKTNIPKVAFLFTGQGSQYVNMGRQLYETQPIFRQTIDQCNEILQAYLDKPLLEVLYPQPEVQPSDHSILNELNQTVYTQPALFAIEYALAQLWKSWGIKPDVVIGHSVGEYVAACLAGIFSLADGLKLIAARGRLMHQLPAGGKMVALMASESQVRPLLDSYADKVAIAALNGPTNTVISGAGSDVDSIADTFAAQGIKVTPLKVSHAFHSPLMQPMLAEFATVASTVKFNRPRIALISNVTGQKADDSITTSEYWIQHISQPVRFADSIQTLQEEGCEIFMEIGAKPILIGMGRECLPPDVGIWLPSLRPPREDWQQILQSLAQLYLQGLSIDWAGFDQGYACSKVFLPTYSFDRKPHWVEISSDQNQKISSRSAADDLVPTAPPSVTPVAEVKLPPESSQPNYLSTLQPAQQNIPLAIPPAIPQTTILPTANTRRAREKIVQQQLDVISQQMETLRVHHRQLHQNNRSSPVIASPSATSRIDSVVAYHKPKPDSRIRLFCFHGLVSSAYIFQKWSDNLPPEIEVVPVEFPGRNGEPQEQVSIEFVNLIVSLEQLLKNYLDKPFAFWGHSLGAIVGYELAHLLNRKYGLQPVHLFVGGARTPHALISDLKWLSSLSPEELLNRHLNRLENFDPSRVDGSLRETILSWLKADLKILLSYKPLYSQGKPLASPISAFGGWEDSEISPDEISQWSRYTLSSFQRQMFPGGHSSFLSDHQSMILNATSKSLILPE
jgi:malonyl CoA-acyl carrier protein transacylase